MTEIAALPEAPYYAVIFTTLRADVDAAYGQMAEKMDALARLQPGYIGIETARSEGGLGITVSYWESENALIAWKKVAEHSLAQKLGRERWYKQYALRVAKVERQYTGPQGRG